MAEQRETFDLSALSWRVLHPSEIKVLLGHVDGPGKLVSLGLVVDLVQWHLHVLTPEQCNKRYKGKIHQLQCSY